MIPEPDSGAVPFPSVRLGSVADAALKRRLRKLADDALRRSSENYSAIAQRMGVSPPALTGLLKRAPEQVQLDTFVRLLRALGYEVDLEVRPS
jgi:transcriptional regulator with XRE-family HTH domain